MTVADGTAAGVDGTSDEHRVRLARAPLGLVLKSTPTKPTPQP